MKTPVRRPILAWLTVLLCLTSGFAGIGSAARPTRADGGVQLPPAPVFTGVESGPAGLSAAGAGPAVNPTSRAASAAFFFEQYQGAPTPSIAWTGDFDDCLKGTTDDDFKEAVRRRILYFRAMAGVPTNVGLSPTLNDKDQQAALMMGKAGQLSHEPGTGWPCYTADGADAAENSNLALGVNGWEAINVYMWDFGEDNGNVGHRRWLLYPPTTAFGTGDVPDDGSGEAANALWVFNNVGDSRPATRDPYVAWPPRGYVPYQVVYPRWSFSYPGADFTDATVTMVSRGNPVPVALEEVYPDPSSGVILGEPTIVWRPNNQNSANGPSAVARDTRFQVTIANVIVGGQSRTFAYDVIVFDPATPPPPPPDCDLSRTAARVGTTITVDCENFEPNETVDLFWDNTRTTPRATIVANANGEGSAPFRIPSARSGKHRVIAKGRVGGIVDISNFTVQPGISISPKTGEIGDAVKVSLTGFAAGESITIKWYNVAGTSTKTLLTGIIAGSSGSKTTSFVVPRSPTGSHKVRAIGNAGGSAQTYFSLVAPAVSSAPEPTATASPTASPTATTPAEPTPTAEPAATESATPEPTPPETPTPEPTPTETPTLEPTATATPEPIPAETPAEQEAETESDPAG